MRKREIELLAYVMANPIRVAILRFLAEGDKKPQSSNEKVNYGTLCPKGWAWMIEDCDFWDSDCDNCSEHLAPILQSSEGKAK